MRSLSLMAALLLFIALTAMRGDASKSVNLILGATFTPNAELPNGGLFVMRGEGSNAIITINLPMPPPEAPSEKPIALTYENITRLDVKVKDDEGVEHVLGRDDIETAAYVLEFNYTWDNGVEQAYIVKNNYDGKY